ncbi:MAG TPA: TetR family transcriptional regulator [Acidimicrobiales bacterium]|nr:TetR family transcriptional regulator [Acidimicrobiales bacterium]
MDSKDSILSTARDTQAVVPGLRGDTSALHQGLRERKKAIMRELISNTATLMFLERGFDEVKVSEIAAACEVSEKTIYNYFPTKESLVLDREEESALELRKALGPDGESASPVEAMIGVLRRELENFVTYLSTTDMTSFPQIADFNDLIDSTPSLKAARADMIERLAQIAAESMAERAGVDPSDPEPQIAADALTSLWRIFYRAIVKYSLEDLSMDALRERVMGDVTRAARLLDTGLWSFGTVVQGTSGREEFDAAAHASIEARQEVLAALKQARAAWLAIKTEMEKHAIDSHDRQRSVREMHDTQRALHDAHREAFEIRREARQRAQEIREEARKHRDEAHKRGQERRDDARKRREEARKFGDILKDEIKKELKEEARQRGQELKDAIKRSRGTNRP